MRREDTRIIGISKEEKYEAGTSAEYLVFRTLPWGTAARIAEEGELELPQTTLKKRPVRYNL